MEEIRWEETDPQGQRVVLKASTLDEHIINAHDAVDANYRLQAEEQAKRAIAHPHIIIRYPHLNDRRVYYKLILMPDKEGLPKVKSIRVVVDADREPNEVVTWVVESRLRGRAVEEWIIYGDD